MTEAYATCTAARERPRWHPAMVAETVGRAFVGIAGALRRRHTAWRLKRRFSRMPARLLRDIGTDPEAVDGFIAAHLAAKADDAGDRTQPDRTRGDPR